MRVVIRPTFAAYVMACGAVAKAKGLPCTITAKEVERALFIHGRQVTFDMNKFTLTLRRLFVGGKLQ